jgi:hypothetical protein
MFPGSRCKFTLAGLIQSPISVMNAKPIPECQHPVNFFTIGGKNMKIAADVRRLQKPVLKPGRLTNPQFKTLCLQGRNVGRFFGRVHYGENDIDYGFS